MLAVSFIRLINAGDVSVLNLAGHDLTLRVYLHYVSKYYANEFFVNNFFLL